MAKDNKNRCTIARVTKLQDFTNGVSREKNNQSNKEYSAGVKVRAETTDIQAAEGRNSAPLRRGSLHITGMGSLTTIKEGWLGNENRDSETPSNVEPSRPGSTLPKGGGRRTSLSNTNAPRKPNKVMISLADIEDSTPKGINFFKKLNIKEKPAFNVYGSKIVKSKDLTNLSEKMAKDIGKITDKIVRCPTNVGARGGRAPRSATKFAPDYKNNYRSIGEISQASPSKVQRTRSRDAPKSGWKSRDAKGIDRYQKSL